MTAQPETQRQQAGHDYVELFLDCQRPSVEQGLVRQRILLPVIVLRVPEQVVREKVGDALRGTADFRQFARQQQEDAGQQGERHGRQERRENAPHPPHVEMAQRKPLCGEILQQQQRDQVARDDKENVHPDKAAVERIDVGMEQHDRQHGQRAQAVDIWAVLDHGSVIERA